MQFLALTFDMEALMRTLAECERRGLDIGPPLRKFGAEKRRDVAQAIKDGKGFAPHSPATIAYYQRMGASDKRFTLGGKVRSGERAKLEREAKRIAGLRAFAAKKYGKYLPPGLQRRFDAFDKKLQRIEAEAARRREHAVVQRGQVGANRALGDGPTVRVKIVSEGGKKRARITTAGYNQAANVAFPRHLRKVGAAYELPASAVRQVNGSHYRVQPTKIVRDTGGGAGGQIPPILGRVPQTLYYKVIRKGRHWLLVWGSRWKTDGRHNAGDEHNPKREHITLTGDDVNRLTQILVSYGIAPLRGAG